jgi:hypothetical protein
MTTLSTRTAATISANTTGEDVMRSFLEAAADEAFGRSRMETSYMPDGSFRLLVEQETWDPQYPSETVYVEHVFTFYPSRKKVMYTVQGQGKVRPQEQTLTVDIYIASVSKLARIMRSFKASFSERDTPSLGDSAPLEHFTERGASLRTRLIRLAASKPEIRAEILSLLD